MSICQFSTYEIPGEIHHLSCPLALLSTVGFLFHICMVEYAKFDQVVCAFGRADYMTCCLACQVRHKSAFRLLPISPGRTLNT